MSPTSFELPGNLSSTDSTPSNETGILVETVDEAEIFNDEEDDVYTDEGDGGSIAGSDYDVDPSSKPTDRVLLTEEHCRAIFTPNLPNSITRVCGMTRIKCSRKHKSLRATLIGPPGYYLQLPPTRRDYLGSIDGEVGTLVPLEVYQEERSVRTVNNRTEAETRNSLSPQLSVSYAEPRLVHSPDPHDRKPSAVTNLAATTWASTMATPQISNLKPAPGTYSTTAVPPRRNNQDQAPETNSDSAMDSIAASMRESAKFNRHVGDQLSSLNDFLKANKIQPPCESVQEPAIQVHTVTPPATRKKKFYAVARGRNPGVYKTWEAAVKQVSGFSNALHQAFGTYDEAMAWIHLKNQVESEEEEEDYYPYVPPPFDDRRRPPPTSRRVPPVDPSIMNCPPPSLYPTPMEAAGIVPPELELGIPNSFAIITSDISKGDSTKVMGFGVKQDAVLLKALSPKGSSLELQNQLASVLLDATALPGTYVSPDAALDVAATTDASLDALSSALMQLVRSETMAKGGTARDTLWNRAKRNSLLSVKSLESLQKLSDDIAEVEELVMDNMTGDVTKILADYFWTDDEANSFCAASGMVNIPRWTLLYFKELLLLCLARVNSVGWGVVEVDLKYYTNELHLIRTTSANRWKHLVGTYVFLRDASKAAFMTHKQLTSRVTVMNKKMLAMERAPAAPAKAASATPAKRNNCSRCNGTFHLELSECPFVNVTYSKARAAAKLVQTKIDGGMSKAAAIKEVLDSIA